ncbi:MAG TPA: GGDEF domain-containing protein [Gaiellaceae bacterium]|nr:GGDEF domain-containing protein [Gaiellaceae bacterium]
MRIWESTTWLAAGASALATVAVLTALALALRLHRAGPGRPAGEPDEADAARKEVRRQRAEAGRARSELRWLRSLAAAAASGSLETVLHRALEAAADLADAAGAMLVLPQGDGEPLVATFGLTADEASRELPALPPGGSDARAVLLAYRYTDEERRRDDFRLTGGLALAVTDAESARVGTLAVFWRRVEREATEEELGRLEALAAALGPALANAFRFDALRRQADLDDETGLHGRRSLERALERECARSRRYGRPVSVLLLRLEAASADGLLRWGAERLERSLRAPDLAFHLGGGRFAAVLPEASLGDAEQVARRLEPALTATLSGGARARAWIEPTQLADVDDAVSLLARAELALEGRETGSEAAARNRTAVDRGP